MNAVIALAIVVVGFAVVLVVFAVVARTLRARMRRGRFHGIDSSVGGSAFMGAPRERGITPPNYPDPHTNTEQTEQ